MVWSKFIVERIKPIKDPLKEKVQTLEKSYKMESRQIKTLIEEILKALKRIDNKFEKLEEKLNKIKHGKYKNITKYSYKYMKRPKIL